MYIHNPVPQDVKQVPTYLDQELSKISTEVEEVNSRSFYSFKNKIENGNFDIWQRETSQTTSGYGSDDRWLNAHVGSTKTHSRQTFALGQNEVPNNPTYFSRTVVSSVAGASNYVIKLQRFNDVTKFSGKKMTLSFYAKADSSKSIAIEFLQNFGTGGTPSAGVNAIGVSKFALTNTWKKYTTTIVWPSIAGKTLGTDPNSSFSQVFFWLDAGSSFNSRTGNLGQQSGTFDIAQVQFEEGENATSFDDRPVNIEEQLCLRYYCTVPVDIQIPSAGYMLYTLHFPVYMARTPYGAGVLTEGTIDGITVHNNYGNLTNKGFFFQVSSATAGAYLLGRVLWFTADL